MRRKRTLRHQSSMHTVLHRTLLYLTAVVVSARVCTDAEDSHCDTEACTPPSCVDCSSCQHAPNREQYFMHAATGLQMNEGGLLY